jgi:hypothetical protein
MPLGWFHSLILWHCNLYRNAEGTILVTFIAIEVARNGASLWISKWANSQHAVNRTMDYYASTAASMHQQQHHHHQPTADTDQFGPAGPAEWTEQRTPTGPAEWLFGSDERSGGVGSVAAAKQRSSYYYIGVYGAISGGQGTVRVFRQKLTIEDAIGSHACSLEANTRVTNGIPLGSSLLLPVCPVNCVQILKRS